MTSSKTPKAVASAKGMNLPAALIVDNDAALREALTRVIRNEGQDVIEALRQVLASQGYDVVLTPCPAEARRLMAQRSFDRVYSGDGTPLAEQASSPAQAASGPKVEDLKDGTARVRIDQVVPWPVAVELLDLLSTAAGARRSPS